MNDGAAATDMEISAQITDGALVKDGPGLLRLTATNTYSGGTTLDDGTLQIVNSSGLGSGSIYFNGGSLSLESDAPKTSVGLSLAASSTATTTVNVDRAFTKAATGEFDLGQAAFGAQFNLSGAEGGSLTLSNVTLESSNVVINNSIPLSVFYLTQSNGADGFEKMGSGTFTLNGQFQDPSQPVIVPYGNTGTTTVDAGYVELDNPRGTSIQSNLVINGPGAVQLLTNDQINDTAPVTLNGVTGTALLDLNGFSDVVGQVSFVAGGLITTGTGTLNAGGNFSFSGSSGSASITGNLNLGAAMRTFTIADGSAVDDMVISANISGAGGIIKAGSGELNLKGSDSFSGGVVVNAGTLVLGSSHTLHSLAINGTSAVKLSAGVKLASMFLAEPSIASGAQLDVTNSDLILRSTPIGDVRTFLHTGFAGGFWTGSGAIDSSAAAALATTTHKTGIAYSIVTASGRMFDGIPVNVGDVLLRYDAMGDANMDGTINALDFNALASGYGASSPYWINGDFNYDGTVNSADFAALAANYGEAFSTSADVPDASLGVLIPEPSTALLCAMLTGVLMPIRRRRIKDESPSPSPRRRLP